MKDKKGHERRQLNGDGLVLRRLGFRAVDCGFTQGFDSHTFTRPASLHSGFRVVGSGFGVFKSRVERIGFRSLRVWALGL